MNHGCIVLLPPVQVLVIMPDEEASPTEPPTEPLIPPGQEENACAKAIVSEILDRSINRYMYGNLLCTCSNIRVYQPF